MPRTTDQAVFEDCQAALIAADVVLSTATLEIGEPHSLDDVTVELLSTAIAGSGSHAEVVSVSADVAHSGMTDRRRLLLEWNEAGRREGMPSAVFVKATPALAEHRTMLAVLHMAENEVRFFNDIRPSLRAIAPTAYYARSYPGGRFLLVLEDLTTQGFRPYAAGDRADLNHVRTVVAALAELHAAFWESSRFAADLGWVRPYAQRYGFPWLRQYHKGNRAEFCRSALAADVPLEIRRMTEQVNANDLLLYEFWSDLPGTFLHGDSHLGNTYSAENGTGGLLDWQVCFRGHGTRDLAYFISVSLPSSLRKENEQDLFDLYLRGLSDGGVELDRDEAWALYRLFIVDIWDAHIATIVTGTFNHRTERSTDRLVSTLLDNDVPALVSEFVTRGTL